MVFKRAASSDSFVLCVVLAARARFERACAGELQGAEATGKCRQVHRPSLSSIKEQEAASASSHPMPWASLAMVHVFALCSNLFVCVCVGWFDSGLSLARARAIRYSLKTTYVCSCQHHVLPCRLARNRRTKKK